MMYKNKNNKNFNNKYEYDEEEDAIEEYSPKTEYDSENDDLKEKIKEIQEIEKNLIKNYGKDIVQLPFLNGNEKQITILEAIMECSQYFKNDNAWNSVEVRNLIQTFIYQTKVTVYLREKFHLNQRIDIIKKYNELKERKPWDHDDQYKIYDNVVFDEAYYLSFLQLLEHNKKRDEIIKKEEAKKRLIVWIHNDSDYQNKKNIDHLIVEEQDNNMLEINKTIDHLLNIFPYPLQILQKMNQAFEVKIMDPKYIKRKNKRINNNEKIINDDSNIENNASSKKRKRYSIHYENRMEEIKKFMQNPNMKINLVQCNYVVDAKTLYHWYMEYCHLHNKDFLKRNIFFIYLKKVYQYNIDRRMSYGIETKYIIFNKSKLLI